MAVADQTLNFMIPAAWCNGTVTIKCKVWDATSPGTTSAEFVRTIVFTDVKPLNLYIVGVNYTAVVPNVAAPTQADFTNQALPGLVQTYPVGDIVQNGYATIQFNQAVTSSTFPSSGCGSGFEALLSKLRDMRGGSGDIYVAVLPANVNVPPNTIGGCGSDGVAAIFIDYGGLGDLPHECGHALGRQHAPCNHGCNPSPSNVDPNYPQYGNFPSDSIGVFGFDPTTNSVFSPASMFDFMSYSFGPFPGQWVSAYTYAALGGAFAPINGPGAGAGAHALQGVQAEMLLLRIEVSRDRQVTRIPAFHHLAPSQGLIRCSSFTAELLDKTKEVLVCQPLACYCDGGCHCWPKKASANLSWSPEACWLVIWEGSKKIYEEAIPVAPVIKITSAESKKDGFHLKWFAKNGVNRKKTDLWFVVHWYDDEMDVWRGVAPRQQETSLVIPASLFVRSSLKIRVLGTSGIATGYAEIMARLDGAKAGEHTVLVSGPLAAASNPSLHSRSVLHAIVIVPTGRQVPAEKTTWYDNRSNEIARGSQLDTRILSIGRHVVRVVSRHSNGHVATGWLVERRHDGACIHHQIIENKQIIEIEHKHPHKK
jgi:hypothetical protein